MELGPVDRITADAVAAAVGQPGAPVRRGQGGEVGQMRRLAQMPGQEFGQLSQIAAIGLHRARAQPPFALKMGEEGGDGGAGGLGHGSIAATRPCGARWRGR
jgi:hypothetical protein